MQTLVDNCGIFIEVSRRRKLPPSPRWSPSQGIPRKGQAPSWVTPWIASGLPHAQVGLRRAFRLKRRGPCSLWYTVAATPQTRLLWSRKTTSPTEFKHSARKHLGFRDMQTSLATRPKPRASAYERGLTNLSTSQSTYANRRVFL